MSHRLQSTQQTFLAKSKQGPCPIKVLLGPTLLLTQNLLIQPETGKIYGQPIDRFLALQQPQTESDSHCSCQEGLQEVLSASPDGDSLHRCCTLQHSQAWKPGQAILPGCGLHSVVKDT